MSPQLPLPGSVPGGRAWMLRPHQIIAPPPTCADAPQKTRHLKEVPVKIARKQLADVKGAGFRTLSQPPSPPRRP
jgi:hypothetical protein